MLTARRKGRSSSLRGLAVNVGLLFWVGLVLPSGVAQDSSGNVAITSSVSLVVLPVSVRDRAGQFVSGLQASSFRVYEDGHSQNLAVFQQEDIPVTVGLVVDRSGSMAARQLQVVEGAQAFVHASNPENREFIVNFANSVSLGLPPSVEFSSDIEQLTDALSSPHASGTTTLYDAIVAALEHSDRGDLPKKALVLISDGGDNASQHTFAQALHAAQGSNVVIYSIGLLDEHSSDQNPDVLKKLASETGGQVYFPNSLTEIVIACQQIAADIRQQYTLGYNPLGNDLAGYHKIRVSVTASGRGKLSIRTRSGFFLPPKSAAPSLRKGG